MYRIASLSSVERTEVFETWLAALEDKVGKANILARIIRLETGNFGNAHSVGGKVSELVIDVGPGYRVYFTRTGHKILLLLCGGDKSTQAADIRLAQRMVADLEE